MNVQPGGAISAGGRAAAVSTFSKRTRHVQMNAHFTPGETLVLTFAPRATLPGAIWGLAPIRRLGHSIVCFVDLAGAWYPQTDIMELKAAIADRLRNFRRIITYGHSMGGYAALKYGALFSAKRSVALGPAWSVAPQDVQAFDERRPRLYYRPDLHDGMAIQAGDAPPDAIVVFDPCHREDRLHFQAIAAAVPQVRAVPNRFVDHSLLSPCIDCGAGTAFAREVIEGTGPSGLRNLIRQSRGASPHYVARALAQLDRAGRQKAVGMMARTYGMPLAGFAPVQSELRRLGYGIPDLPERPWLQVFRNGTMQEARAAARGQPLDAFRKPADIRRWLAIHAAVHDYVRIGAFVDHVLARGESTDREYFRYASIIMSGPASGDRHQCRAARRLLARIRNKRSYTYVALKIKIDIAIHKQTTIPAELFVSRYSRSGRRLTLPAFKGEFIRGMALGLPPGTYGLSYDLAADADVAIHLEGDVLDKGGHSLRSSLIGRLMAFARAPKRVRRLTSGQRPLVMRVPKNAKNMETFINIIMKSDGQAAGRTILFREVHLVRL